jgi:hypothetical protein
MQCLALMPSFLVLRIAIGACGRNVLGGVFALVPFLLTDRLVEVPSQYSSIRRISHKQARVTRPSP